MRDEPTASDPSNEAANSASDAPAAFAVALATTTSIPPAPSTVPSTSARIGVADVGLDRSDPIGSQRCARPLQAIEGRAQMVSGRALIEERAGDRRADPSAASRDDDARSGELGIHVSRRRVAGQQPARLGLPGQLDGGADIEGLPPDTSAFNGSGTSSTATRYEWPVPRNERSCTTPRSAVTGWRPHPHHLRPSTSHAGPETSTLGARKRCAPTETSAVLRLHGTPRQDHVRISDEPGHER